MGVSKQIWLNKIIGDMFWAGMGLINYDGIDCEFCLLYFASIVPICMYRVVIGWE